MKSAKPIFAAMTALIFAVSPLPSKTHRGMIAREPQSPTAREIAQNSFRSAVLLVMEDTNRQPVPLGSGFFVSAGVVATNFHVIEGTAGGYAKLIGQNTKYEIAGTVGVDSARDLALLSIPGAKAPALLLGDSKEVAVGDEAYVVGNPRGLEGTFSQGIISGIRQVGSESLLQITAPISPGSSGGPVLNSSGKAIGVAALTFREGQNLNFAIPISYVQSLMSSLHPVTPLAALKPPARESSILSNFGRSEVTGVVGGQFLWDRDDLTPSFSFTLRNQLRSSVKNVYCLVVFYDSSGTPIDVHEVHVDSVIPAGLGVRVSGERVNESVKKLSTSTATYSSPGYTFYESAPAKFEFRVLDFELAE